MELVVNLHRSSMDILGLLCMFGLTWDALPDTALYVYLGLGQAQGDPGLAPHGYIKYRLFVKHQ